MSGEDATVLALLANGGHGCISVTANVAPRACVEFYGAWGVRRPATRAGPFRTVCCRCTTRCSSKSSPAPVKYAASLLALCSEDVRSPLAPLSEAARPVVADAMRSAGILN